MLGLTPYLYLPIRAAMDPPMDANNPRTSSGSGTWSAGNLTGSFFSFGPAELPGRMLFYGEHLLQNLPFLVVMVALTGAVVVLLRDRAAGLFLGFLFFGWLFYSIENDIPDIELYFIPTYLVLSLWAAAGFGALLDEAESLTGGLSKAARWGVIGALSAVMLLLPLFGVGGTYARSDMSGVYRGRKKIKPSPRTPRRTPRSCHRSSMWYMVLVEKRRRDLTLVDLVLQHGRLLGRPGWPADIDLKPRTAATAPTTSPGRSQPGWPPKGRVYLLDQESTNLETFRAGFRVVVVKEGLLYELPAERGNPTRSKSFQPFGPRPPGRELKASFPARHLRRRHSSAAHFLSASSCASRRCLRSGDAVSYLLRSS